MVYHENPSIFMGDDNHGFGNDELVGDHRVSQRVMEVPPQMDG